MGELPTTIEFFKSLLFYNVQCIASKLLRLYSTVRPLCPVHCYSPPLTKSHKFTYISFNISYFTFRQLEARVTNSEGQWSTVKCDQCETLNSLVYSEKNLIWNILNSICGVKFDVFGTNSWIFWSRQRCRFHLKYYCMVVKNIALPECYTAIHA